MVRGRIIRNIEAFATSGRSQFKHAVKRVEILASDWHEVTQTQRVVEIDKAIDSRNGRVRSKRAPAERFNRTRVLAWLCVKTLIDFVPACNFRMVTQVIRVDGRPQPEGRVSECLAAFGVRGAIAQPKGDNDRNRRFGIGVVNRIGHPELIERGR
ncbi:hypothetical protein WJ23_31885 [Burkholderia lata]|nr:hypothetical protein WJ23_31885 [Burkholderia lata]